MRCFGALNVLLLHVFNLSIQRGIFPDKLKITHITPISMGGNKLNDCVYTPISVLPILSKKWEKIICYRVYEHLNENNLFHKKRFFFMKAHSTEHIIVQLADHINTISGNNISTLIVFIDILKELDTAYQEILISFSIHFFYYHLLTNIQIFICNFECEMTTTYF